MIAKHVWIAVGFSIFVISSKIILVSASEFRHTNTSVRNKMYARQDTLSEECHPFPPLALRRRQAKTV